MREDWRAMLLNAFVMVLFAGALIIGAFVLIAKAIYKVVRP